jgi:hypothetical protein
MEKFESGIRDKHPGSATLLASLNYFHFDQEKPRYSLKKTLKFEIQLEDVLPLETQVAGHGTEDQGGAVSKLVIFTRHSRRSRHNVFLF